MFGRSVLAVGVLIVRELVCAAPGTFALDFYRCPVNYYFQALGKEELEFFRNSWCTMDWPFAEAMVKGGKYERRHTLSAGDNVCDMRWRAHDETWP